MTKSKAQICRDLEDMTKQSDTILFFKDSDGKKWRLNKTLEQLEEECHGKKKAQIAFKTAIALVVMGKITANTIATMC